MAMRRGNSRLRRNQGRICLRRCEKCWAERISKLQMQNRGDQLIKSEMDLDVIAINVLAITVRLKPMSNQREECKSQPHVIICKFNSLSKTLIFESYTFGSLFSEP